MKTTTQILTSILIVIEMAKAWSYICNETLHNIIYKRISIEYFITYRFPVSACAFRLRSNGSRIKRSYLP